MNIEITDWLSMLNGQYALPAILFIHYFHFYRQAAMSHKYADFFGALYEQV